MDWDLIAELSAYGVTAKEYLSLQQISHDTINYLDLQNVPENGNDFPSPDAVIEVDGHPLLYVVKSDSLLNNNKEDANALISLRSALACRGEHSYLGIVEHGQITIVPNHYARDLKDALQVRNDAPKAGFLLRDLAMGIAPASVSQKVWNQINVQVEKLAVHDLLFRLLDRVTEDLRNAEPLKDRDGEILSLVGRVLFTCFLLDRKIINELTFPALYASQNGAFANPTNAALTCRWLDETFNGELLPLDSADYVSYFNALVTNDNSIFLALSKIIERTTPDGQYFLDCSWINFSHVPIGLLSQVYESYAHKFFGENALRESIHYTPRYIAEYMVEQAFTGIDNVSPDKARVLDPAAGAGVFLVLCFRRLVQEHWKRHGRPNTLVIRQILNDQIRGYDINGHALKLAALSLYLTAIELDPSPLSGENIKFSPLDGHVLFNSRLSDEKFPCPIAFGSLGFNEPICKIENHYDLVIGNPPWTPWSSGKEKDPIKKQALIDRVKVLNRKATELIRRIAKDRNSNLFTEIADNYQNALNAPDLPFVWRAMEWAKPNAVIAFALHGRLLFRRADSGAAARDSLFKALRITGILNGAALRQEKVWQNVSAPFCLLFARNNIPSPNDHFYFVSPDLEKDINQKAAWRIDYQSAHPVEFGVLTHTPSLLKTLFRGTALDADLVRRIDALLHQNVDEKSDNNKITRNSAIRLGDYWQSDRGLFSGQGFIDNNGTQSAKFILEMGAKELTAKSKAGLYIDTESLANFGRSKLLRPRAKEIYRQPLVLFSQTPGSKADSIKARICLDKTPIAYNFSFYGFSTYGHKKPQELACYLFVIANSDLLTYYILMTSARFGVERDTVYVEDIEEFPIIPIENLTELQINEVKNIAHDLYTGSSDSKILLNQWVTNLYGLDKSDYLVISDTLSTNSPTATAKKRAQINPTPEEIRAFVKTMQATLQPFFDLSEDNVQICPVSPISNTWQFLNVLSGNKISTIEESEILRAASIALADHEGASRIMIPMGPGHLCIGILSQYRYWTPSRARLTAMDIMNQTNSVFCMEE